MQTCCPLSELSCMELPVTGGKLPDPLSQHGVSLNPPSSQLSSLRIMKMSWLIGSELESKERRNPSGILHSRIELSAKGGSLH